MLATDLAEYLVRKGVPFRETHHISGEPSRRVCEAARKRAAATAVCVSGRQPGWL